MEPSTFTSPELNLADLSRLLAGAGYDVGRAAPARRTVLDTFDGRLHAAGLRLEVCDGERRDLVLADGGPVVARLAIDTAPRFAGDLPSGPFRARLAPLVEVRALLPKLRVTSRRTVAVRRGSADKLRAALVLHQDVSVEGSTVNAAGCVAEVDEMLGYPDAARRARRLLISFGLEPHRGDMLELLADGAGVDLRGHRASPTVALDRNEPAFEGFRKVLTNLADAVDANWAGTVDDVDTEFLHELRVAVRRTRSVLSQSRAVLPDDVRARYREGFAWLGTATSPVRDLDVYLIEWQGYVEPLGPEAAVALGPLREHIAGLRRDAHVGLVRVLRSTRYQELMGGWRAWLGGPARGSPGDATAAVGRVAGRRIATAQARLLARGRSIEAETPAEELHELRKDAKRLRYSLECFGGVLVPGARKAFVHRLKALQDNLGEHQDTEVHAFQLRTFSRELFEAQSVPVETFVAMGQLADRFDRRRQVARDEFTRRFAAYDTKDTARTLKALLHGAAAG